MSYFSTYDSVNIKLHKYNYEPLGVVLSAYRELKQTESIDSLHAEINKYCKNVINRLISGKKCCAEDIDYVRELCKKKSTNSCYFLYRSIKFIDFSQVVSKFLESFYLGNEIDHVNIFVDSIEHWEMYERVILQLGLEGVFTPIFKDELRSKYFKSPILFFSLPQWVESTLIIPPASELHFAYPSNFDYTFNIGNHISANNGQSLALVSIETKIQRVMIDIEPESRFYELFPKEPITTEFLPATSENIEFDFEQDPIRTLNVKVSSGNKLVVHKTYLAVMENNRLIFSSFETESDLDGVKYIVSSIDASEATTQSLLKEQIALMDVWKKPLKDSLKSACLIRKLEILGAEKASEQNIKNWADTSRIAPRGENDFRAVLKFAGINDEEDIKNYFYLAYKQRGDSISIGHKRSYLTNEIVKRYIQEKINSGSLVAGEYYSHGIKFQVEGVNI
jgi:hypothetical protein